MHSRTQLLLGKDAMSTLAGTRVIIFGVGGVGSWCAESLVRSGVGHITIVDSDLVCRSNCNRQIMATSITIGQVKVDALKARLKEINPDADVLALRMVYNEETADSFHLESYDYVIDAIDSLKDKAQLILHTTRIAKEIRQGKLAGEGVAKKLTLISSMGAALRIDPSKVCVTEFWKVRNDPLGAALRKRFRSRGQSPSVKFKCVYSEELPMANLGAGEMSPVKQGTSGEQPMESLGDGWSASKAQVNGSLCHITAIFGLTIAGLVMQDAVLGDH